MAQSHQTPWLMLPSDQETDNDSRWFFNLEERKAYKVKNMFGGLVDAWCVGSSHGWLIVLDEKTNPHLFNPFSRAQIKLPSFPSELKPRVDESYFFQLLRKLFVSKAVLSFHDQNCCSKNNYVVVVIYGNSSRRLAFCMHGNTTWTDLGGMHGAYSDIIFHGNQLYALADNGAIEVWEFGANAAFPTKIMNFATSGPIEEEDDSEKFPRDKFSTQGYLVESMGDLLFVRRFIGNFVDSNGIPIDESDLLDSEDTQPLVCPYRTKLFRVYKLDVVQKTWKKMESLRDRVLFLGGNQSISLSVEDVGGCEANSIYFTDDNWDQMNEDYLYGGHDLGIFNLTDGSLKTCYQCEMGKMDPPPFWIINPNDP